MDSFNYNKRSDTGNNSAANTEPLDITECSDSISEGERKSTKEISEAFIKEANFNNDVINNQDTESIYGDPAVHINDAFKEINARNNPRDDKFYYEFKE